MKFLFLLALTWGLEVLPSQGLHPAVRLLDAAGVAVHVTGEPLSPERTCGTCHDVVFIKAHNNHKRLVLGWADARNAVLTRSGELELDCLLCHLQAPDVFSRADTIEAGQLGWAATATLAHTGLVERSLVGWAWKGNRFSPSGEVPAEILGLGPPRDGHCGACHGRTVHAKEEVRPHFDRPGDTLSAASGAVFSGQQLRHGGYNLVGRETLTRPWDVHAERQVGCVACHLSPNNPARRLTKRTGEDANHLLFDPRGLTPGQYLLRPSHEFSLENPRSLRRCQDCHDPMLRHSWLPYKALHFSKLACETCHIPKSYHPARSEVDRTVLTNHFGSPRVELRGVQWDLRRSAVSPVEGFEPILIERADPDGQHRLHPNNLVTTWHWEGSQPAGEPSLDDLRKVYFDGQDFRRQVLDLFDRQGDGTLRVEELTLDTDQRRDWVQGELEGLGNRGLQLVGTVEARHVSHGVIGGSWALRSCLECHTENGRPGRAMRLTHVSSPLGRLELTNGLREKGEIVISEGEAWFEPRRLSPAMLGNGAWAWLDRYGVGLLGFALAAVAMHGGLRWTGHRRRRKGL